LEGAERQRASTQAQLERAERTTAEAAVQKEARRFAAQALRHYGAARRWSILLGGAVALLLATSFVMYAHALEIESAALAGRRLSGLGAEQLSTTSLQLTFARIVLLSLLATATIWIGRVYKAHRHNQIVNEHRANALAGFREFSAASDPDVKKAVLIQATQCIFTPQHTGFIADEPDTIVSSPLTELLRSKS
jgi:hypothetical protein